MPDSTATILIIDNDDGLVTAISARLEHLGYHCVKASSGAQGVAAFQEQRIDLVITDLNMPAGNGITLTKTLRRTSSVPIIIATGFHEEFGRELRSVKNVTIVEKPFSADQLIDLVEADLVMAGCELPDND